MKYNKSNKPPTANPAHQLMPSTLRKQLLPLYSNQEIGLEGLAPVKYFLPDGSWIWYASEFDGKEILFGLVIWSQVKVGYFPLSGLRELRDANNLPVKRDLAYTPQTLKTLYAQHLNRRVEI